MKRAAPDVWSCVGDVVTGMGYEFVGARYGQEEGGLILRVFIDSENGISVDDCAEVSHQLSAVLDVEDILTSAYSLEVSSPGIDRPLFDAKDFQRFNGDTVAIKLAVPQNGRRRYKGRVVACEADEIEIEIDGECHTIPLASVDQANLVPSDEMYRMRN
ncbi:MAG: ribosome maturation factor RimP [Pseudomonadota bacterium]